MKHLRFFGWAVIFCGSLLATSVDAQAKKKAKPLATPPPVLTGADIIMRADDYAQRPVETQPTVVPSGRDDVAPTLSLEELLERIRVLESSSKKPTNDERQKRLLLNLDIITRAEQRSESLRKQLFEMIEKENTIKGCLEQIELDMRPEAIERTLQLTGSMRPEEVRTNRRKSLEAERTNLQSLLGEISATRRNLNMTLQKSDVMVDKLRIKLEKDIDDALVDTDKKDN